MPNFNPVTDFKAHAVLLGDNPAQLSIASALLQQILLPDDLRTVNRCIIDFRSVSFVGTITIKGRAAGTALTPVAITYNARKLNGVAGISTGITTGITTDSQVDIDTTGLDLFLDTTAAYTSGTMTADIQPEIG